MRKSRAVVKTRVTKDGWRCERCTYEWVPRSIAKTPTVCPKCKSPYWNRPLKTRGKE